MGNTLTLGITGGWLMPWLETVPMEQRERFIRDWQLDLYTMTELSARYDVSRKTGYKWLERFDEGGRQPWAAGPRPPTVRICH